MSELWTPSSELRQDLLFHPALSSRNPSFTILPDASQVLLAQLEKQSQRWGHKPYFKANVSDRRIALVNGYHKAKRLLDCAMIQDKFTDQPYGRCKLPWFCPYCGYLRGQDLLKKYGPAWKPGQWHWLVFSLRGGVCVANPDHYTLAEVWDAMRACIKRLDEVFPGYEGHVAWEELAIYCFWPSLVWTPHVNVLIKSTTEPDCAKFNQIVRQEWKYKEFQESERVQMCAPPDAVFAVPNSEAHFYEILQYVKPIDLMTAYESGHRQASEQGRLVEFHQEVRSFFEAYQNESFIYQDRKIRGKPVVLRIERNHYYAGGTCHGSARLPVGIPKHIRWTEDHQDAIRERVAEAQKDEKARPDYRD